MIIKDFVAGLIASFVPLTAMSFKFDNRDCTKNGFSFTNAVRTIPIFFGIINVIVFYLLRLLGIRNFFLIGFIFAIIYSSFGRFVSGVPTKVFDMENPNYFHLYAIITWGLFYGIIIQIFYKYIC